MLIKAGVDISRLNRDIRRALTGIDRIVYAVEGFELVITSTYEGNHLPGSAHYVNDAVDIRRWKRAKTMARRIREALGESFFVYVAASHIHVGYDPK